MEKFLMDNWGHIVSLLTLFAGMVAGWTKLNNNDAMTAKRLDVHERLIEKLPHIEFTTDAMSQRLEDFHMRMRAVEARDVELGIIKSQLVGIKESLVRIDGKLERMNEDNN